MDLPEYLEFVMHIREANKWMISELCDTFCNLLESFVSLSELVRRNNLKDDKRYEQLGRVLKVVSRKLNDSIDSGELLVDYTQTNLYLSRGINLLSYLLSERLGGTNASRS